MRPVGKHQMNLSTLKSTRAHRHISLGFEFPEFLIHNKCRNTLKPAEDNSKPKKHGCGVFNLLVKRPHDPGFFVCFFQK